MYSIFCLCVCVMCSTMLPMSTQKYSVAKFGRGTPWARSIWSSNCFRSASSILKLPPKLIKTVTEHVNDTPEVLLGRVRPAYSLDRLSTWSQLLIRHTKLEFASFEKIGIIFTHMYLILTRNRGLVMIFTLSNR